MQRRHAVFQKLRVAVENMYKLLREYEQNSPDDQHICDSRECHKLYSLAHSSVRSRPVVISEHRLRRIRQAADRHRHNLAHGVYHCHDSDVQIASVDLQRGIAHHLDDAVRHGHDKTRHAERHDFFEHLEPNLQVSSLQMQNRLLSGQELHNPYRGYHLRDDGRCRRSAHAPVHHEYKDRIENDIQDRSDQHGEHSLFRKSLRVDKTVHSKAYHYKNAAAQIDAQVIVRISDRRVARAEQIQYRALDEQAQDRQNRSCKDQHGKRISHDLLRPVRLLFAPGN